MKKMACVLTLVALGLFLGTSGSGCGTDGGGGGGGGNIAAAFEATASHCWANDSVSALNDGSLPTSSGDHDIPRMTWWDHRGTTEWVQYDFPRPLKVTTVEVYWFDDTGRGQCRVPQSWQLLYRDGTAWRPVQNPSEYGVKLDGFNEVSFHPVRTDALRLEVQLRPSFSGGILEWRVTR